jgi:hypothetical protein
MARRAKHALVVAESKAISWPRRTWKAYQNTPLGLRVVVPIFTFAAAYWLWDTALTMLGQAEYGMAMILTIAFVIVGAGAALLIPRWVLKGIVILIVLGVGGYTSAIILRAKGNKPLTTIWIEPREQRHITADLIIDHVEEKKITGHSVIYNHFHITSGSTPPAQITIRHVNWDIAGTGVWGGSHEEDLSNLPRDLPPNQGLDIKAQPLYVLNKDRSINIELYVYYESTADKTSLFWTYRFALYPEELRSQTPISPYSSSGGKGEYNANIYQQKSERRFASKKGSVFLTALEVENGKPNVKTLLQNNQRRILFDANLRMVRFEMNLDSVWVLKRSAPLREGENGIHLILAAWNASDGLLFVDSAEDEINSISAQVAMLVTRQ